jgi:sigma-B regulation protein RsbU (phosphoserine phosphatase)
MLRKVFEILLTILFYSTIFILADQIGNHYYWIGFFIVIFLFVFLHDKIRILIRKIISYRYYKKIRNATTVLELLNSNLNKAIRYHDVTKQLFSAFDKLFPKRPYVFFILENDKYYLAHYANCYDSDLILLNINLESTKRHLPENMLVAEAGEYFKQKDLITRFEKSGLTTTFIFRGHAQPIALLVCQAKQISFLKDSETRRLFEKIQKKAGLILENTSLLMDLEHKNKEVNKLIEVSQQILSSFDTKNILDFVIKTLKSLIRYDAAAIFLLDKSGKKLLNTSSDGYDIDQNEQLWLKMGQGAVGWTAQTGKIDVLEDVRVAGHYCALRSDTRSQVSIPLVFDNEVFGVLCLESNQLSYFHSGMVDTLKIFAHLVSIAIHNARQLDIILANKAYEYELINASTVQKRLLVQNIPVIPPLKISAVNISSKIVSGDLYDVIKYDENALGLAIGDVSGKGAPAALMMALILAGLRSHKQTFLTVCDLVYRLNNLLEESTTEGKYASFFYGVIDMKEKRFYYTNAGHNPPIYIKSDGRVQLLTEGGPVLGFISDQTYKQGDIPFGPGDLIVAYTDGISEAMNANEEEFGEERLIDIVSKKNDKKVHEIKEAILDAVNQFSVSPDPLDDMTLLICKFS